MSPILLALMIGCQTQGGFTAGGGDDNTIQGQGEMVLYPSKGLQWDDMKPGFTCTRYVRVESVGIEDLAIDRIDITNSGGGVFSMDEILGMSIPINEAFEFNIQARIDEFTAAEGELRIRSNDLNGADLRIPLIAIPADGLDSADTGEPEDC